MNNLDWVNKMEIELHNKCNLLCPLCVRQNNKFKEYFIKTNEINFNVLIQTLNRFKRLTKVHLVGNSSEPTLYTNFLDLIKYLKNRNISIMISTNASTKNNNFWKKLSNLLNKNDEIRFAIDGSTQERYNQYRVNGKLNKVLNNVKIMETSKAFKVLQIIRFKGNEKIYYKEIEKLNQIIKFDYVYELNTNSEIINSDYLKFPKKENIKQMIYNNIFKELKKLQPLERLKELKCYSKDGFIYINHRSEFITCCDRYEEFLISKNLKIENFEDDKFNDYYRNIYNKIQFNETCLKNCNKKLFRIEHDRDHLIKADI